MIILCIFSHIECSIYSIIPLISRASKVMVKILLQARLQQYVNRELPGVQAGFRKRRGTRDQIANISWLVKKAREFQKNIYFCFIDFAKAFVWITTNCRRNFIAPSKCDTVYVESNSLGHVFMKLKSQIWANYNLIF